ncbi:MAG TPA: protein kinase family protein [Gammaproteobacteria bacterium]|nr:protein kinase family protein [Gammaproteobacteria bacterium]
MLQRPKYTPKPMGPDLNPFNIPHTDIHHFPPEKIDIDCLDDELFLLPKDVRELIKKHVSDEDNVRIPRRDLQRITHDYTYGVLVHKGRKFIVYDGQKWGREAGTGGFGVVKYLQDLESGEWFVIKNYSQLHDFYKPKSEMRSEAYIHKYAQKEYEILDQIGCAIGGLGKRTGKKGTQEYIVMKAFHGVNLDEYLKKNMDKMHPMHVLDIMKQICRAVHELHLSGWLHRDIKLDNFLYHHATGAVTLIDYNLAVRQPRMSDTYLGHSVSGTTFLIAPESFKCKYSPRSDTYSTGIAIGDIFSIIKFERDAGKHWRCQGVKPLSDPACNRKALKNEDALQKVYRLVCGMLSENENDRPSLTDVISEIAAIQHTYQGADLTVGVVGISEFDKLSEHEKENYIRKIKASCYEVVLTASAGASQLREAMKFIRELQSRGLRVYEKIFHSNSVEEISAEFNRLQPYVRRVVRVIPVKGMVSDEYDELTNVRNIVKGKVQHLRQFFDGQKQNKDAKRSTSYFDGALSSLFWKMNEKSDVVIHSYDDELESNNRTQSYD